jgi:hypothetical protein
MSEPLAQHTRDYWDDYRRRRDILRSRHPHLNARELHYRSLPTVANEAPAPSKPAPEADPAPSMAKRLWPYME